MLPDTTITRPALRYYGGKWNLAPWIISHFPAHKNYVEPCGGAASVLLQKPRSPLETYNDTDGGIVNFFRVLRDRSDELISKIQLTPYARAEFELSWMLSDDPVESARRYFFHCWMSMNGMANLKIGHTWRARHDFKGTVTSELNGVVDLLPAIVNRFREVQIESINALDAIARYDNADALIYFDPPYLADERSHPNIYTDEQDTEFHADAAELLRSARGYVVISGYACATYRELYEDHGWTRIDTECQANGGAMRTESLWLSPRTVEALNAPRQASLFGA